MAGMAPPSSVRLEHSTLLFAVGSWSLCSVGMLVFNKLAIKALPHQPCSLVSFQFLFTVLVMVCPPLYQNIRIGSLRDVLRWSIVIPFFTGMVLSSILTLKYAPMAMVMTFRALSPVFALIVESFYPNPLRISPLMMLSLLASVFGMWLYLFDMDKSNLSGMGWAVLNNFFAVGDRLLQRYMLGQDQNPVDISKSGVTVLNNALGMIPLLAAAFLTNEFPNVVPAVQELDTWGHIWVIASGFVGVGISFTGIWVQTMISATSFLVLINANKFVVLFLEVFVMKEKTLGNMQIAGAIVSILACVVYGKAREVVELEEAGNQLGNRHQKLEEDENIDNEDSSTSSTSSFSSASGWACW